MSVAVGNGQVHAIGAATMCASMIVLYYLKIVPGGKNMDSATIGVVGIVVGSISALMSVAAVASGIFFYLRQERRYFEDTLPFIRPYGSPKFLPDGQLALDPQIAISFHNTGRGLAQIVCAVLFGGEVSTGGYYWEAHETGPIGKQGGNLIMERRTKPLHGNREIGGHTLCVSRWDETSPYSVRFTVTYQDFYGHKCLSMWDYDAKHEMWVCRVKKTVKRDLHDVISCL